LFAINYHNYCELWCSSICIYKLIKYKAIDVFRILN